MASASDTLPDVNVTAPAPSSVNQVATPWVERQLSFTFQLGTGTFGASGSSSLSVTNLRAIVHIEFANAPTTGNASIRIYGLTLDQMNNLSKAGLVYAARHNTVVVQAGNQGQALSTVFTGNFIEAYPDMREPPPAGPSFYITASPAVLPQMKPVAAASFTGATKLTDALAPIVKTAGLTLEGNGVATVLSSPYFAGTAWSQILSAVKAADCFAFLDGNTNTLAIWPKDGSRSSNGGLPVLSAPNGMIGYPEFQGTKVRVRMLFNTSIVPGTGPGHQVQIVSQLKAATGMFTAVDQTYDLSSQMPDGPWEMSVTCVPVSSA